MYRPVTEEIPPDEIALDTPVDGVAPVGEGVGGERPCPGGGEDGDEDRPVADHSAVADPGVEFSSSRSSPGLTGQHQPRNRIQLKWEPHYLTTLPGIMKMLQLILTLVALICATSISYKGMYYLSLPAAWKFRVFTFTSVLSLLSCVGFLFVRATNLARVLPVDWLMVVSSRSHLCLLFKIV
ncbi:uncharacterized protein LOC117288961 [Asterias rubens]|uniref:uncharacterized protein LOC117288961 n=1 Tax=Asterias rubens TaxID=7604 RepID=UPI0014557DC9|nr:uncharacterized protein LOC117288961 [Asterias rubens]